MFVIVCNCSGISKAENIVVISEKKGGSCLHDMIGINIFSMINHQAKVKNVCHIEKKSVLLDRMGK